MIRKGVSALLTSLVCHFGMAIWVLLFSPDTPFSVLTERWYFMAVGCLTQAFFGGKDRDA